MQIRRFDNDPHGYAQPKSVRSSGQSAIVDGSSSPPANAVQTPASQTEPSDTRLAGLSARLQNVPQVRSAAVEAAREKLAKGEFTTRQAAQQLAATDLRNDIF